MRNRYNPPTGERLCFKWTDSSLGLALSLFGGGGILPIGLGRRKGDRILEEDWGWGDGKEMLFPEGRGLPHRRMGATGGRGGEQ